MSTCCRRWYDPTEIRRANLPAGSKRQPPAAARQNEGPGANSFGVVYPKDIAEMLHAQQLVHTFSTLVVSSGLSVLGNGNNNRPTENRELRTGSCFQKSFR